jgi:hypothetical protein
MVRDGDFYRLGAGVPKVAFPATDEINYIDIWYHRLGHANT